MSRILVRDQDSLEGALKRFMRKVQQDSILSEARRPQHYESPSMMRKRKLASRARQPCERPHAATSVEPHTSQDVTGTILPSPTVAPLMRRAHRRGGASFGGKESRGDVPKQLGVNPPLAPEVPVAPVFLFSRRSLASEHHIERNEDLVLIDRQRGLAAVFDGVGGCPGGEIAARISARVIRRGWRRVLREAQPSQPNALLHCADHVEKARVALISLLEEAHDRICAERPLHSDRNAAGPESTVALAVFSHAPGDSGYRMTYAWVGDSRVYLCRDVDSFELLTQDDGLLSMLVRLREISTQDAARIDQATHPEVLSEAELSYFAQRNGLSQALGDSRPPHLHVQQVEIGMGDRVLLCTDGIHDNVTRGEIATVLATARHTRNATLLVEAALQQSRRDKNAWMRAKPDDMTAVIVTRVG
jgi:PPM family protein phosphatase